MIKQILSIMSVFTVLLLLISTYTAEAETVEDLEKRIDALEKHVDKHITHAEVPALTDGLSIAAGITSVVQGTSGNDENSTPGEDVIDGNISTDLEISGPMGKNGEGFIALEAGNGMGLDSDEINSFWGVNADGGFLDSNVAMTEAWYEHRFAGDTVTFTTGKLNLTNYFDASEVANDETTQFLSGGFVNSVAIEFPENSAALRITVTPAEILDISIALQSGDSDWEDIFEKPFLISEVALKLRSGELQGNYRVYAWTNRVEHTEWRNVANDKENNTGYGISADQQVTEGLTVFARAGYQDKKVSMVDITWSAGVAISGSLWGRNNDVLAAAYGEAMLSSDYERYSLIPSGTTPGNEGHFEAYYSIYVNEHISISPDVQVVTNANGDDNFKTVTIGAVRGQFTF